MGMGLPQQQMPGVTGVAGVGAASGGGGGGGSVFGPGPAGLMSPAGAAAGLMPATARPGVSTGAATEGVLPQLGGSLPGAGAMAMPAAGSVKAGGTAAVAGLSAAPPLAAAAVGKGKRRRRPERSTDADRKAQEQIVRRRCVLEGVNVSRVVRERGYAGVGGLLETYACRFCVAKERGSCLPMPDVCGGWVGMFEQVNAACGSVGSSACLRWPCARS